MTLPLLVEHVGLISACLQVLAHGDLSAIRKEHGGDTATCLLEGLCLLFQGERTTWRALADAVANTNGGNDLPLAKARVHKN